MKTYQYKDYEINVQGAPTYSFNSVDNKYYDKILIMEESDFYCQIEMEITKDGEKKKVLLIAPRYTPMDSFVEVHEQGLFLMLDSIICLFNLELLEIIQQVKIDSLGTMFEVHVHEKDYILYGEIEIYRINSKLQIVWKFSGRDIFVRYQGDEPAFEMKEDKICLIDYLDNYYEIDYDGNVIVDRPFWP